MTKIEPLGYDLDDAQCAGCAKRTNVNNGDSIQVGSTGLTPWHERCYLLHRLDQLGARVAALEAKS